MDGDLVLIYSARVSAVFIFQQTRISALAISLNVHIANQQKTVKNPEEQPSQSHFSNEPVGHQSLPGLFAVNPLSNQI